MSQQAYHNTRQPVNGPCTCEDAARLPHGITVALYRLWPVTGDGYVVTARNGHELDRIEAKTQAGAQAAFDGLVARYTDPCNCYDLPDGRAYICPTCRQRVAVEVF